MICHPERSPHLEPSEQSARISLPDEGVGVGRARAYGPSFWLTYTANLAVMIAVALLYRYADFVTLLGGTEFHLGWIVGVGMVGSLTMRLMLGTAIDRIGPRRIWLCSLVVLAAVCFAHLGVARYDGLAIYALRILFCLSLAGIFGSSMTFVSGRVPSVRMAEMIGMLGTSGFVGMVLGTQLGDLLCGTPDLQRWQVDRMFLVAGSLGTVAVLFAALATRGLRPPQPRRRPPTVWLLRRYNPGMVLLVAVSLGVGLGLPATFLRTFAAELGIARIGLFFAVYAPAAIVTRVVTRRLPERLGLTPMILISLGILIAAQLLLIPVRSAWMFVVPGITYGIAHAILFPTTVAAASRFFPDRYRGLGTMFALSAFDVGQLVGAPAAGVILHYSALAGLPSYPTLFVSMAVTLTLVGAIYAASCRRRSPSRRSVPLPLAEPAVEEAAAELPVPALVEVGPSEGAVRSRDRCN